jgi:maleylacetate reductase
MMRAQGTYGFPAMDQVIYGKPAATALVEETARLGAKRVFLVVSRTLNTTTDEIEKMHAALGGRYAGTYDSIPQHTTRTSVVAVARAASEAAADLIVAVGGGSVVDVAKTAIMCMEHEITVEEGLDGYERVAGAPGATSQRSFRAPKVRTIAIPTTLSGGEYNAGALVTDTKRKWKQIFYHREMMPISIILDPAITRHTPEQLWLGSGTRSLDHGIEALCSHFGNPLVDAVVTKGIETLGSGLRRTKRDPSNIEARRICQIGSWLSAFGLQARVPMGASHAIGHVLGGTFDVPHYLITPVLLPAVLRYNKSSSATAQRAIIEALSASTGDAADCLDDLFGELGLPRRLEEVGISPTAFRRIGEIAVKSIFAKTNPRPLETAEAVVDLLQLTTRRVAKT